MATEIDIRATLREVDKLRNGADIARKMNMHWMGHDGELVIEHAVTVKRRWRSDKTTHSAYVMTSPERDLFLTWLSNHGRALTREADTLTAALTKTPEKPGGATS
jgi:hypothetical protein